ncbi:hypothetical protein IG631_10800 [Alternaria alternata]|nr:hypothetical protein IG631_10800 [Alternaria alternata]
MRERTCPIDDSPQPRLSKQSRSASLVGLPWFFTSWRLSLYHVERMRRPVKKRGVPWTTSPRSDGAVTSQTRVEKLPLSRCSRFILRHGISRLAIDRSNNISRNFKP